MGERLEKYRSIRRQRRKYRCVVIFFLILLLVGLCIVDYSSNYLIKNEHRIAFVAIKSLDDYNYEICFFNKKFYISTYIIKQDIENIKNRVKKFAGF